MMRRFPGNADGPRLIFPEQPVPGMRINWMGFEGHVAEVTWRGVRLAFETGWARWHSYTVRVPVEKALPSTSGRGC